jgi:hypothetical protein
MIFMIAQHVSTSPLKKFSTAQKKTNGSYFWKKILAKKQSHEHFGSLGKVRIGV